jgi:hypothetical protein
MEGIAGGQIEKINEVVKSPKTLSSVIPVKTGIQEFQGVMDSRSPPAACGDKLRGSDGSEYFLRDRQH